MNVGFYSIFKGKLEKLKSDLKEELGRAKSDRRKDKIKDHIRQIKSLSKNVEAMEAIMEVKTSCPHCGGKL